MLCDAPKYYEQEKECTEFIAGVPTVWDETLAIDGKVGEYIVIARRSGDTWFIGGITGQDACDVNIDLSFLGEGKWKMTLFTDGINSERHAEDYKKVENEVNGSLTVHMSKGGGFALKLSK